MELSFEVELKIFDDHTILRRFYSEPISRRL